DRVPAVAVAQLAEEAGAGATEPELGIARIPLIADALIVGARDLQRVEAEVAGIEIGTEHVLFLPRESERAVHQQRRAKRPRLAGGELVHLGVAAVARRVRVRAEVV